MDYSIHLMKDEETAFAYTQKQEIMQESGCIGHLRVDMDSSGTGFFTSWDNHNTGLKTAAFVAEFDEVIHELRFGEESGGFLKNRDSVKKFAHQHPESSITEDNSAFGLRVDTNDHTYMVRMNPNKGEYAAYIYAYNREILDAYLEPAQEQSVEQEGPMTVLVVEPGKAPYVKEIDPGLASLQHEVGGWIQAVYPFEDPVAIICNEEGKLEGLPLNRALFTEEHGVYDIVAGTFLVTGLTEDNFGSLTDAQVKKFSDRFRCPEAFLNIGGKILVIPQEPPKQRNSVMGKLKNQPAGPKKEAVKKPKEEIR